MIMSRNFKLTAILLLAGIALVRLANAAPETSPASKSPLRVGVAPTSPPMIFKEGKQVVGVEADLAQALGRDLGREIRFVELPWENLIDALNEGKIDIIMSSMSITRPRQFRVAFSEPYMRISQMALIRAEDQRRIGLLSGALNGQRIGVKKGTTADLLVQQEFPKAKRKFYTTCDDGAKAVKKKSIDLFISDSPMIWYLAGVYEADGLVVSPIMLSDELLAWGVNRSDPSLLDSVNAFLKKAKDNGELNSVLKRWIPMMK
jgi:ABC-type amino acid transport substrate-binding protein